jgi:hypothetical protein
MPTKTWNLTLTPPGASPTTLTDIPHDEMFGILRGMLYGATPAIAEREAAA